MIVRIVVGLIWFLVLYFGACIVAGAVAGGMAANADPAFPTGVSPERAARDIVLSLRVYFLYGAATVAIFGTLLGILPGTGGMSFRRIVMGLFWFAVCFFATCAVAGAIACASAENRAALESARSNEEAFQIGIRIGAEVTPLRGYFLFGAACFAGLGTLAGVLPGTRPDTSA